MKMYRESRYMTLTACAAVGLALAALTATPAGAQTKVTDKWIKVVIPAEPTSMDGCNSSSGTEGRVMKQNLVETMTEKDPVTNEVKPRLAISWQRLAPDTWRFKLRQGVTFHDGATFNAEAVKKSLERNMSKVIVCRDKVKYTGDFTIEVTAVDDYTVDVKASRPEPIMPMRMAGIAIVSPNTTLDKLSNSAIGTGPYAFDSWLPGQQILMKRYDKYWGAKPEAEGAVFLWRDESSVRAAMVAVGEADLAPIISKEDARDAKTDTPYLNSETTFLRIDTTYAPLNDVRVRLALNYGFDREGLRNSIFSKDYQHATQMVFPAIPGHNFELDKMVRSYDPAKAKQLLAQAKAGGTATETPFTLLGRPSGYPKASEIMEVALANYQALGLNVKLQNLETGPYNSYNYKPYPENRGPTILQNTHDNNFGDPVFSAFFRYGCDGAVSPMCFPDFDKEVARVTTLEGDARVKGWQGVFRMLYEDLVPEVWMYHMVGYARVNPRIDFKPDVTTNNEVRIQEIHFAKK